jgi:hypothetical protein
MKWIILIFLLAVTIFSGTRFADAHGGGDLIVRSVQAGPYTASVWVNPPDPRALEPIHFTVGLASPADHSPVLDADIQVTMWDKSSRETAVTAPVTTEQSVNKLFYETDVEVSTAGDYDVEFRIRGAEGEGTVTTSVVVQASSSMNWLVIGLVGLGVVVILGWWRSRQTEPEAADA